MTRRCRSLSTLAPEAVLDIHPEDAARLGIADGGRVALASRRGRIEMRSRISSAVDRGVVFTTFHFSEAPINRLTNDALDPVAKIPEFKVCAVRVEKI
jgi:formate dehydrogenase major subunit